jgi:uncharacterized membrane protein
MIRYFKYFGWALVLSASLYFLFRNVPRYFVSENGFTNDMLPFKSSFLIHFIAGTIMLLAAPIQFISTIRKKMPKVHRYLGRVYVISVVISALVAIYISIDKMIFAEGVITFATGLIGLAVASLVTTLTAYAMIRNRNYEQHREWMIRSYIVTLGFVTFRIFTDIFNGTLFQVDGLEIVNIMAWACWSIPLLITEMFLQLSRTHKHTPSLTT